MLGGVGILGLDRRYETLPVLQRLLSSIGRLQGQPRVSSDLLRKRSNQREQARAAGGLSDQIGKLVGRLEIFPVKRRGRVLLQTLQVNSCQREKVIVRA